MTDKLRVQTAGAQMLGKLGRLGDGIKAEDAKRAEVIHGTRQIFDAILASPEQVRVLDEALRGHPGPQAEISLPGPGSQDFAKGSLALTREHDDYPATLNVSLNFADGVGGGYWDVPLDRLLAIANEAQIPPEKLDAALSAILERTAVAIEG